jgi:hypothetical protein
MFDYLQQFNSLPKDLRDQVSSPSVMAVISELENKYRIDLAMMVMKVMIKSLTVKNLPAYFISESGLSQENAENLVRELKERVFISVAGHLGLSGERRALDLDKDIEILIKEAGLVLPSAVLIGRFKNIIATYLRGVRNKIDTRNSLAKDAKIGGLNLSAAEIDRVLKICDNQKFKSIEINAPLTPVSLSTPSSRLDKIIASAEHISIKPAISGGEYNLQQALAAGQVKPVQPTSVGLDIKHELSSPIKQLDLPAGKPTEGLISSAPKVATPPAAVPKAATVSVASKIIVSAISKPITPVKPTMTKSPIKSVAPTVAANRPAPAPSAARPQMHDIKLMPKIMGPIEELQFLDLVNFRRLSQTPTEATAKIFAKIKLLERDGYDKMVAGVRAWRQSPLNRFYLRLGQEAIGQGVFLKEIIAARQKAGQEYLRLEEIEAIVSLNSKLVF